MWDTKYSTNSRLGTVDLNLSQLRSAIPAHCFKRTLPRSLFYVVYDLSLIALIYVAYLYGWIGYGMYMLIQGTIFFGIFVLGHECGHGAFSEYPIVNDTVGFILHTGLLVPYFSWQKTHEYHHLRTNHLIDGSPFVPATEKGVNKRLSIIEHLLHEDALVVLHILNYLLFGWPAYLLIHGTGSRRSPVTKQRYKHAPNHFNPYGELFPDKLRGKVAASALGVGGMIFLLIHSGVWRVYIGPYLIHNAWLVLVTWLQHTSKDIPHYGDSDWTWIKGALCTVDRPYPWIIDHLHHHLGSTHVCHHLFPTIPHYHAMEATKALKITLGELYNFDKTSIATALWNTARDCEYVDGVDGVQFYKSRRGRTPYIESNNK